MIDIHSKFEQGKISNTFLRVDDNHKLDIFIGYATNGKATLTILDFGKAIKVESSQFIEVNLFKQRDSKISLSFTLKESDMYNIFIKFCEDIIESVRTLETFEVIEFIIKRWNAWISIFKKAKVDGLGENQIIGLLGELIFLGEYMIPRYGESNAITSWQGPQMLHKDFEIGNTWYEVKTKSTAATTVKISSIEQLDSEEDGYLSVVKIEKTNSANEKSINLNSYIKYLELNIKDYGVKLELIDKLSEIGYLYDDKYNSFNYKFDEVKIYEVKDDFPRLKRKWLNGGVARAVYDISIENIKEFECKEVKKNEFTRI
ncbi:MAG: PD-(D/E)XK motif protein [Sarcina sp.]